MKDFINDPEEVREYQQRFPYFYALLGVILTVFVMRLWYLQIVKGSELRDFSEQNRLKHEKIVAPRGLVFDRNGEILVDNLPGFHVTITPQYVSGLQGLADDLSKVLDIDAQDIISDVKKSRYQNGPFRPVVIKENVLREDVIKIEKLRIKHPGLEVQMAIQRSYMLGPIGAQLLGYIGEISKDELSRYNKDRAPEDHFEQGDIIGKSGFEQIFDSQVRGHDGMSFMQVDAHGREIADAPTSLLGSFMRRQEPKPGHSVVLTIDKDVQEAAWKALSGTGRIGGVLAIEPKTGEIIAWVVAPSFDPSAFSTGPSSEMWAQLVNDPFKPLRNKVIQDHLAPGSTFKAIVALAALQEKVATTETTVFCPGFLKFGKKLYHCHLKQGHGFVTLPHALEQSCNIFFYKMGIGLGIDRIAKYARALGLGVRTNIGIPNEAAGLIPDSEWKKRVYGEEWQPGENLSNAIGQGFVLVTPIQLLQAYTSIANRGPVYKFHVVKKVLDVNGKVTQEFKPELKFDPSTGYNTNAKIDLKNYDIVRRGLWLVANGPHGTGVRSKIPGIELAGKTGTTQLFQLSQDQIYAKCANRPIQQRHHGWFVTYAPAEDPKIAVVVLAEHSCSGAGGAAPVAKEVVQAYIGKYYPEMFKKDKVKVPSGGPDIED